MKAAESIVVDIRPIAPFYLEEDFLFQSHWRRFAVSVFLAALASALMLGAFAELLISQRPTPRRTSAIYATLVEPEPVREKPAEPKPVKPILHPVPRKTIARIKPRKEVETPQEARPGKPAPSALPASTAGGIATGRATVPSESQESSQGEESGGGVSDDLGARALYAPVPQIPDDLRENVFSAVAIAHFVVDREGHVQVTLVKPTPNPRLNHVILESLRTWKFFPAVKDGVAIASEFDVRIPIAVQ